MVAKGWGWRGAISMEGGGEKSGKLIPGGLDLGKSISEGKTSMYKIPKSRKGCHCEDI